ncbi:hypothetical protein GQ43DRAFT_472003 [Delitschia confertaspora ATCC 74209]|uniref:Uncharacterized protein n=1 Tax=Delitschia confertaspora ATCC 74209 TaxID=1513339 RepID=A0A9P4JMY8_9PLEO|nr:hypothetical protein GQ43DRAFT_472003 [Delitschia confertaspora ATCC 74209]
MSLRMLQPGTVYFHYPLNRPPAYTGRPAIDPSAVSSLSSAYFDAMEQVAEVCNADEDEELDEEDTVKDVIPQKQGQPCVMERRGAIDLGRPAHQPQLDSNLPQRPESVPGNEYLAAPSNYYLINAQCYNDCNRAQSTGTVLKPHNGLLTNPHRSLSSPPTFNYRFSPNFGVDFDLGLRSDNDGSPNSDSSIFVNHSFSISETYLHLSQSPPQVDDTTSTTSGSSQHLIPAPYVPSKESREAQSPRSLAFNPTKDLEAVCTEWTINGTSGGSQHSLIPLPYERTSASSAACPHHQISCECNGDSSTSRTLIPRPYSPRDAHPTNHSLPPLPSSFENENCLLPPSSSRIHFPVSPSSESSSVPYPPPPPIRSAPLPPPSTFPITPTPKPTKSFGKRRRKGNQLQYPTILTPIREDDAESSEWECVDSHHMGKKGEKGTDGKGGGGFGRLLKRMVGKSDLKGEGKGKKDRKKKHRDEVGEEEYDDWM